MTRARLRSHRPVTRLYPLTVFFAADGVVFASWVVRVPEIKEQVGASATALGFALLCMTFSSAVSMYFAGGLCERFGTRAVTVASFPLVCAALILPGLARSVVQLGAILLLFGVIYGVLLVALNSAAVEVEAATGRAIMSPLHGLWSLGGLVGAVIGGVLADLLSTPQHLSLIAVAGVLVTLLVGGRMLRPDAAASLGGVGAAGVNGDAGEPAPAEPADRRSGRRSGRRPVSLVVVLFGVVALCTAYGEGAVGDWAALHLRDDLGAAAGVAAYGFGAYSVAIAAGRLIGGRLINLAGETWVLTGGALIAGAGILVAAWAQDLGLAFAGLVAVGFGLANMFPIAIARAGAIGGPRGVGLASTIGNTGMLAGPPLIGFLADQLGLPAALSTIAILAAIAAVLGFVLREHTTSRRRSPEEAEQSIPA